MRRIDGYKTYIIAGLLALLVAAEKFLGWDVPGVVAQNEWLQWLLGAAGLAAVRHGVAKVERRAE